jgi:hypothetical protein
MAVALRHNDFGHFRVEKGDRQHWALRATCYECHQTEDLVLGGGKGTLTQDIAEKNWRNRGWQLGKDRHKDRCPRCIGAELMARRKATAATVAVAPAARTADWKPTQEEINAYLKDVEMADGSQSAKRRKDLAWYPQITRGGERFIWALMAPRLLKQGELSTYRDGWGDTRIGALITQLVPGYTLSVSSLRQIRIQGFGPARPKLGAAAPQPTADMPPLSDTVVLHAPEMAQEPLLAAPGVVVPIKPAITVLAPETAVDDASKTLARIDGDLITLFEGQEKLSAQFNIIDAIKGQFVAMVERVDKVEKKSGTAIEVLDNVLRRLMVLEQSRGGSRLLSDYSIPELLAEIARKTGGDANDSNVVPLR